MKQKKLLLHSSLSWRQPHRELLKINAILLRLPPWSFGRKRLFISVGYMQSVSHTSLLCLWLCKSKTLLLVKRLCSPWGVKWLWVEFLTPGPFVMPTPKWLIDWLVACSAGVIFVTKKIFKVVNSQHSYIIQSSLYLLCTRLPCYSVELLVEKNKQEINKINCPSLCIQPKM